MIYVYAAIAIVILFLLVRLFKWINGPRIEQAKTERRKAWFDFRRDRWNRSGGLLGFFRKRKRSKE